MMKKILLALIFLGIFSLNAQIRIKMVDPSDNTVVLRNYGGSTIDVSSYWFCNWPSYAQISGMSVNSGSTNLASGEEVNITSSINFGVSDAEFGLYTTNASSFANDMIDYLQWGSFGHQRESVANTAFLFFFFFLLFKLFFCPIICYFNTICKYGAVFSTACYK